MEALSLEDPTRFSATHIYSPSSETLTWCKVRVLGFRDKSVEGYISLSSFIQNTLGSGYPDASHTIFIVSPTLANTLSGVLITADGITAIKIKHV